MITVKRKHLKNFVRKNGKRHTRIRGKVIKTLNVYDPLFKTIKFNLLVKAFRDGNCLFLIPQDSLLGVYSKK